MVAINIANQLIIMRTMNNEIYTLHITRPYRCIYRYIQGRVYTTTSVHNFKLWNIIFRQHLKKKNVIAFIVVNWDTSKLYRMIKKHLNAIQKP